MVAFILDILLVAYVGVYYNGDDGDNYASIIDLEIDVCISHLMLSKSIRISLSKIFSLFYHKNLLFLFYTVTKHPHQIIYYTLYFI